MDAITVTVEGGAKSGKTTLVELVRQELSKRGVQTEVVSSDLQQERIVPPLESRVYMLGRKGVHVRLVEQQTQQTCCSEGEAPKLSGWGRLWSKVRFWS